MQSYAVDVGGDDFTSSGGGALQGGLGVGCVNTAAIAEDSHNLLAFGTSVGTIEFWDSRTRGRIAMLHRPTQNESTGERSEITALEFDPSGLRLAAGSSTGLIHLYDLRSSIPLLKKDQGYGYPIQTLIYLSSSTSTRSQTSEPKILSADKRIIKIWDLQDGTPWTSVEPAVDLNAVTWCKDTGMLLTANEGRQQHSFFIPQLGPAPKWCSFLDNLVEEMAEDPNDPSAFTNQHAGEVYDNYKFLTKPQLQSLNLSHLIGTTTLLRPYMHGYFVAQRLYEEARLIANPFVWEEERNKRVKEKIDAERESRIRGQKKIEAKVNRRLAEKMSNRAEKNERRRARKVLENGDDDGVLLDPNEAEEAVEKEPVGLLADPRFAKLFQDEDFAIDERSKEFQSLNPNFVQSLEIGNRQGYRLTAVEEEEKALVENPNSDSSDASSENDQRLPRQKDSGRISSVSYKRSGHRPQNPQMKVSSSTGRKSRQPQNLPFEARMKENKGMRKGVSTVGGEREITFAPEQKGKAQNENQMEKRDRRGEKGRRSASGNVFRKL